MSVRIGHGIGFFRAIKKQAIAYLPGAVKNAPTVVQLTYNAQADFSIASGNPNSAWSYGYLDVGFVNFTLLTDTYDTSPFRGWNVFNGPDPWVIVYLNSTGAPVAGIPAGGLAVHPMPDTTAGVLRWTAPRFFSALRIQGQFSAGDVSATSVSVRRGSDELFVAADSSGSAPFDFSFTGIGQGEIFDFCAYGSSTQSSTPLQLVISGTSPL